VLVCVIVILIIKIPQDHHTGGKQLGYHRHGKIKDPRQGRYSVVSTVRSPCLYSRFLSTPQQVYRQISSASFSPGNNSKMAELWLIITYLRRVHSTSYSACAGARCGERGAGSSAVFEPCLRRVKAARWCEACLARGEETPFKINVKSCLPKRTILAQFDHVILE